MRYLLCSMIFGYFLFGPPLFASPSPKEQTRLCVRERIIQAQKEDSLKVQNGDFGRLVKGQTQHYQGMITKGTTFRILFCGEPRSKFQVDLFQVWPSPHFAARSNGVIIDLVYTAKVSAILRLKITSLINRSHYTVAILIKEKK